MKLPLICIFLCLKCFNCEQKSEFHKDEEEKLHAKGQRDILNEEKVLKEALANVVKKIDTNQDGELNFDELKVWFDELHKVSTKREFEQRWLYLESAMKEMKLPKLNWDSFERIAHPASETKRHRKRWSIVDNNKDGLLSKEEFFAFLYPRFTPKHQFLELHESLAMFDSDSDAKICFSEFYRYVIHNRRRELDPFVPTERHGLESEYKTFFDTIADSDKDGFLDAHEMKRFIYGEQTGVAAHGLLQNHDEDRSGKLSTEEILKSPQHFARMLPHEFWDSLNSQQRDEL